MILILESLSKLLCGRNEGVFESLTPSLVLIRFSNKNVSENLPGPAFPAYVKLCALRPLKCLFLGHQQGANEKALLILTNHKPL